MKDMIDYCSAIRSIRRSLIAFLLVFSCSVIKAESLTLALIQGEPDNEVALEIIRAVYEKLEIEVVGKRLPGKRALLESNNGIVDGEVQRVYEVGDEHPNLIRVPTPFIQWQASAFSKRHRLPVRHWSDLRDYKVAIIRGIKYAEDGVERGGIERVLVVNDLESLIVELEKGVIDFGIASNFGGMCQIEKMKLPHIVPMDGPLQVGDLYHYLHKKHAALVPKVDLVIRNMRSTGELSKLKSQIISKLVAQKSSLSNDKNIESSF